MSDRPNIVFIMCDQMRGDAMGCDGNTYVQTPNIDYLASCGTRFNHAYSAVPSCLPARAILWTGMDQWHAGVLGMGWGQGHRPCLAHSRRRLHHPVRCTPCCRSAQPS